MCTFFIMLGSDDIDNDFLTLAIEFFFKNALQFFLKNTLDMLVLELQKDFSSFANNA